MASLQTLLPRGTSFGNSTLLNSDWTLKIEVMMVAGLDQEQGIYPVSGMYPGLSSVSGFAGTFSNILLNCTFREKRSTQVPIRGVRLPGGKGTT